MNWNIHKISRIKDQILYKHPKYNTIIKTNDLDINLFREYLNQAMKEVTFMNDDMEKAEQYYENQDKNVTKDMFVNNQYDNIRDDEND